MAETLNSTPLVSVVVITYNSSKYVLETLESIKNQTYKNIELVISDDCSTDETVAICQKWVEENKIEFTDAKFISAEKNGGIPANCNQGLNNSRGEFIKLIAGDDLLLPRCVELFLEAVAGNPDASCFASDMYAMQGDMVSKKYSILRHRFPKNASKQLDNFIKYGPIPGPALFFRTDALRQVGGYDERYRGFEDYPMYIKLTSAGYYFVVIDNSSVLYREHPESITKNGSSTFSLSVSEFFVDCIAPLARSRKLYWYIWHMFLKERLASSDGFTLSCFSILTRLTDWYYWRNKILLGLGCSIFDQSKMARVSDIGVGELLNRRS